MKIQICSGCLISGEEPHQLYVENFIAELHRILREANPTKDWELSATTCQRFCPRNRITLIVQGRLCMSPGTTVDEVSRFVLAQKIVQEK